MIDQALSGFGVLGNDMYSPFDPPTQDRRARAGHRQASLLKPAGQENWTSSWSPRRVGAGAVESATCS